MEHTKDPNCGYCMRGELLEKFGIYVCDLDVSTLILFKEQSHPGRCIVAYKDHVSEIVDISDEERDAFFADVARAAKAIHKVFKPDKLNYGAYGDTGCHLHMHQDPICAYLRLSRVNCPDYIIAGSYKSGQKGQSPSKSRNFSHSAKAKNS